MELLGRSYEPCKSCEILKQQLDIANAEKHQLLTTIMDFTKPVAVQSDPIQNYKQLQPIGTKGIPWRVRQAKLEAESRAEVLRRKQHDDEITKLEKEVGVEDAIR
jgi:hypothetical protein